MKLTSLTTLGLAGIIAITGCSGGDGVSSPITPMTTTHSTSSTPTSAPTSAPSVAPSAQSVLQTQTFDGGPAFITSADLPVYTFDGDTTDKSNCTGGCLTVWPSVPPPAGTLPSPWSSFTRSDNGQKQLAYNGAPLYTFSGDSPGVATGNGDMGFSLARPLASATAAPTTSPSAAPTATAAPTRAPTTAPY
jgi:predicted lipoprotein with Yx(FWY)xxD motif